MSGKFEFAYSLENPDRIPAMVYLPIGASQTWKRGDPVQVSSGVIIGANGYGRMLGVAADDQTTPTTSTLVPIFIDQPGFVWKATASADASAHIMDARTYDLDSSLHINIADTTGGCFEIIGLDPNDSSKVTVYVVATVHELA